MKLISSLRIVGGIFGIPMLAVAIVALFWGSRNALMLGLVLGAASLYLVWSAVHVITYRPPKPAAPVRQRNFVDWMMRSILAALCGFAGFMWGMLAVGHKCLAGSRAVESLAPMGFAILCAGTLFICRRYTVGLLLLIVLFVLALFMGFYYKEAIHRGSPEAMTNRPQNLVQLQNFIPPPPANPESSTAPRVAR